MRQRLSRTTSISLAICCLSAVGAGAQEARRKLDYSKVGVYATVFDFCDFSCLKIRVPKDDAYLPRMARMIADVHAQGKLNLVGLYCFDRVKHSRPFEDYCAQADRMLAALDLAQVDALFLGEENVTWNKGLELLNALYDHVKPRTHVPVYQWYSMPMVHHPKQRADGWIIDPYGMRRERFRKYLMKYVVLGKPVIDCLHATPAGRFAYHDPNVHEATKEQIEVCREFNVPMFFYCVDNKYGAPNIWLHSDEPKIVDIREWILGEISKIRATDTSKLPLTSANYSTGQPIPAAGDAQNRFVFEDTFHDLRRQSFVDDAFIDGFLMLRWDGQSERLHVKAKQSARDRVRLIYHFTSEFELSGMASTLTGAVADDAQASVSLSINGHRFEHDAVAGKPGAFTLVAKSAGNEEFVGKEFWVRVQAQVGDKPAEPVALDALRVTCDVKPPEKREVALKPDENGRVTYTDDFQTQKHLHLAEIENLGEMEWQRGSVGTHGVRGRRNDVVIKQKFTCERPLCNLRLKVESYAHRSLGSFNIIGLSLDGKEPLLSDTTRGKERKEGKAKGRYQGVLELDASKDQRFAGVKEFWVHLGMANQVGAPTKTSNRIMSYEVVAQTAP